MSVQALLERAKENGLTVFLEDGRVQVKAAQKPQGEARALINELRQHKQEVLEALTQEDPILSVDEWLPPNLGSLPLSGDLVVTGGDERAENIQNSLTSIRAWALEEV